MGEKKWGGGESWRNNNKVGESTKGEGGPPEGTREKKKKKCHAQHTFDRLREFVPKPGSLFVHDKLL